MPTLHQRLIWNVAKLVPISKDQKTELAKQIADYYVKHKEDFPFPLKRTLSHEPDGVFKVLYYPKQFTKKMDEMIFEYHSKLPATKKQRTRKIISPVKIDTNGY